MRIAREYFEHDCRSGLHSMLKCILQESVKLACGSPQHKHTFKQLVRSLPSVKRSKLKACSKDNPDYILMAKVIADLKELFVRTSEAFPTARDDLSQRAIRLQVHILHKIMTIK